MLQLWDFSQRWINSVRQRVKLALWLQVSNRIINLSFPSRRSPSQKYIILRY
ncbi:MAG: hypothetical protein RM368_30580 [Nostoc sp. DedSLP03]|uniref:hypothetical protein n=1 Tax=Nostoc sp. DedSLP03 TaxID=3075400 RepID=UPI002AD3A4A1|nr:hypothetical protein [Nostoc sp. DedSLP03]MDZ7969245.1 hypothetical protein [Nostoc sp. DedSLP03]